MENPIVYDREHSSAWTSEYVFTQIIPYIGNKRKLLDLIQNAILKTGVTPPSTFLDVFSGSGVVSRMAKKHGYKVISNDWEPYSFDINKCFIECNISPDFKNLGGYKNAINVLNNIPSQEGWVTKHLCPSDDTNYDITKDRMFYTRSNGMRIDAIRNKILEWENNEIINKDERSCLIAPMLYQACYTSNTSGVFKGFHNGWGGKTKTALYRILSDYTIKPAIFYNNFLNNQTIKLDAIKLTEYLKENNIFVDIAYLDPPYNQHPYGANYHVLNTISLWDEPNLTEKIDGRNKAAIREDWRTERRSAYNYRDEAYQAFNTLINNLNANYILISYSTDGTIPLHKMVESCIDCGETEVIFKSYKRYRVSSQRFSYKPMNIEFILIVNKLKKHSHCSVEDICLMITNAENNAIDIHPETTSNEQLSLF